LIRTDAMKEYNETNTIFGALGSPGWAYFLVADSVRARVQWEHSNANTGEVSFMLCA
jgi:hypothetical protein